MKSFGDFNPIAVFLYFAAVTVVVMFSTNPVILAISLCGAVSYYIARDSRGSWRSHLMFFALFIVMALINPLFYHNGETVLFVLNDNPVTLEAVFYGIGASAMIISVLYWFRSFTAVMSSDRLLYLFGSLSPKFALILSMTLRYIPLFTEQTRRVNQTQKALGLYKDDNAVDSIKGGMRVFSVMVTWALENGIITADSMTARGYGTGRRTFFALYKFRRQDAALLAATVALAAAVALGFALGALDFEYYPSLSTIKLTPLSSAAYAAYFVLAAIPSAVELEAKAKWKLLQSAI